VFICVGCAIWAGGRAAIPILPCVDPDRTAAFYTAVGFTETERHHGYLLLHNDQVEIHLSLEAKPSPGQCFIHVGDALKIWKQLRHRNIAGCASSS
jgi:catechol 2,3-dioxygenase-like lactoylglutathione lyase family enzyme